MEDDASSTNSVKNFWHHLKKHGSDNSDHVTEEIISMVNEGHEQGVFQATEAEMITNIFEFGDKDTLLEDAITQMLDAGKSRFPVYHENIDEIVGILHFRDAIVADRKEENAGKSVGSIVGLLRETMVIPETKNIAGLFRMMQKTKTQMVIVVDEYGQTKGVLAMEDILEEIVGNIQDEYDEDEEYIEETGNKDEYIIDGITPLKELEERFCISFQEEEFETLNGFMISKMDKIPEENEDFSVDVDGYNFRILSVEHKMIRSVLVTKKKQEPQQNVTIKNE